MNTSEGEIVFELFDADAPKTVENFKKLARDGFYDGLIFHRVIADFMIQGGCPQGTGTGGPGYTFEDEINDHAIVRGTLAMANAGPNTNGSQFFVVTARLDAVARRQAHRVRPGHGRRGRRAADRHDADRSAGSTGHADRDPLDHHLRLSSAPGRPAERGALPAANVDVGVIFAEQLVPEPLGSAHEPAGAGSRRRRARGRRPRSPGTRTAGKKAVIDPATGETVAWVDDMGRDAAALAAVRGRAVQPAWAALGFAGRARVMKRAQKWVTANADELIRTIVSETGKAWEDAMMAEVLYAAAAFGHWADHAEDLLRRGEAQDLLAAAQGQEGDHPLRAGRAGRRDRAVELPLHQRLRRLHPGPDGGQQRAAQAGREDAADVAAAGQGAEGLRDARRRHAGPHRQGLGPRRRDRRRRRHDHVHRIDRGRSPDRRARGRTADPVLARARRQGRVDRLCRRRPGARRQPGAVLRHVQLRPDLRVGRTGLRRGARLRRVRRQGDEEGPRAAQRAGRPARVPPTSAR